LIFFQIKKNISIIDAGIEMATTKLISNLCTTARSGTKKSMKVIEEGIDLSLIGQFYIDFVSIFGCKQSCCHIEI
jgi:molecular chaperone HtpG